MKRFARSDKLFFLTTFLLGLSLCFNVNLVSAQEREGAEEVEAQIAVGQSAIDLASVVTASTVFASVPNTVVSIPFSSFSRRCILRFSSEARATAGDRLDIRTRINNGACSVAGPEFFSQDATLQTRTNQSIVNVGPGAHTFRPCWRRAQLVADAPADQVQLFFRTYTVECLTN
jgi:hypothetical protein